MSSTKPEVQTYLHDARVGPSHCHRQHTQKLVNIARVAPEIASWTDRQTDTDVLITILRNQSRRRINNSTACNVAFRINYLTT